MTTLAELLNRFDAEKILLLEIDPDGAAPIYISDTPYFTEPGDAVPNQPYYPVVKFNGVPRLTRKIQEVFGGRSVPSWGPLDIATPIVGGVDLSIANIRGKTIRAKLTGPRSQIALADAAVIMEGVVGVRSGNVDEGVTIEVIDRQAQFNYIRFPTSFYDGTESATFPASNIGKPKPLCLGTCRNITPVLIDAANLVYQVNDGAINDILDVYDSGVALTKVGGVPAAGQYSINTANATFTLGGSTSGQPTADVEGIMDGATWLTSTTQIIDWLARTYGGVTAGDIDISGLPGDAVGYYINDIATLADVITALMKGVLGWWGFNRANTLVARLMDSPAAGGNVFGDLLQLSDITWREAPDLYWSIPVRYGRNWSHIQQPAGAVSLDRVAWLAGDGYESRVESTATLATYPWAIVAERIETYFDTQTPADTVATRGLTLFGQPRYRANVSLPMADPLMELGDDIELTEADGKNGYYKVMDIVDKWDGEIPLLDVEVWG